MSPRSVGRDLMRVAALAVAIAMSVLMVMATVSPAIAQVPGLTLVNGDREFVERKKDGRFIPRPVFSRELDELYYAVRDADTGDWVTLMYRVRGGEKRLRDGWEYSWEYPALSEQPELDPGKTYLLVIGVPADAQGGPYVFHAIVPVYQPSGIFDRILNALNPGRWARAFAGWVVEGVHGVLCGVVERATRTDIDICGGGG